MTCDAGTLQILEFMIARQNWEPHQDGGHAHMSLMSSTLYDAPCARLQVPVFIWAPEEEGQFQPGRCSRWWLENSLKALEADFKALGSSLIYRCAPESRTALLQLAQETGAQVGLAFFGAERWHARSN